jgi:hypothetical protein
MYEKGAFEINEVINLPECMNKGRFVFCFDLSHQNVEYHLRVKKEIYLDVIGFPMKTGNVFNAEERGFIFLK